MKLRLLIELEYDEELMHDGDRSPDMRRWFLDLIRHSNYLTLHENGDIGDAIGDVRIIRIIEDGEDE